MDISTIIAVIVVVILYIWYVGIVSKKNKVLEALSGIDIQLKKRSNVIPNILKIAKRFMTHEKDLLTKVTELRGKADTNYDKNDIESVKGYLKRVGALDQSLGRLMVAVEAYPDLKSDKTMLQAQRTYNEVEEHIAAARRFYNAAVASLNNSIEVFPGNLLAGLAKAQVMPFYKTDEISSAPVNADEIFNS